MKLIRIAALLALAFHSLSHAETTTIRIGVQASGTLNWELRAIANENLLDSNSVAIETVTLANPQAGQIALQSGAVDMIVSDWVSVSSQRRRGGDETFYPYSNSSGALLVNPNSGINGLADLQGKKLGIAGGELDKNWLLLQALAKQQHIDLDRRVQKIFGAPPLLSQQFTSGGLDAVLTYWHFGAKLEAEGYRQLLNGEQILQQLGIKETVPSLGYVFKSAWGKQHHAALKQFFAATQAAKNRLCDSDTTWQKITPLLAESNEAKTLPILRQRYCQGRVTQWGKPQQQAAEKIYTLLHQLSGSKLTGDAPQLQAGTFWGLE